MRPISFQVYPLDLDLGSLVRFLDTSDNSYHSFRAIKKPFSSSRTTSALKHRVKR